MKDTHRSIYLTLLCILFCTSLSYGQNDLLIEFLKDKEVVDIIGVENGSFEKKIKNPTSLEMYFNVNSWMNLAQNLFPAETPPTVHYEDSIKFGVDKNAINGERFLGMVVRNNETYEAIGIELDEVLLSDSLYAFSLFTSMDEFYESPFPSSLYGRRFDRPVNVVVSFFEMDIEFKIEEIEMDLSFEWKENLIVFKSPCFCDYLSIYVQFQDNTLYNGHVLLDQVSDIYRYKTVDQ